MKKRLFTIIVTILLALSMALPATAEEGKIYVVDQMGVVSGQLTELNQKASNLSDSFRINVTLLMVNTTAAEDVTAENTDTIPDTRLLPRLTDEADLLTDAEEEELLTKLDEISERQQCDVVVATVNSLCHI